MSCAKTAAPIDLLLGLWIRVGRRKHKFNGSVVLVRWRQCALMWAHNGAAWWIRLNCPSSVEMWPYVKLLWLLVVVLTHQCRSISSMLSHHVMDLFHSGETEFVSCWLVVRKGIRPM